MKAKICGVRTLEDALLAVSNGAWAIGFNFYRQSPRYLTLAKAREIAAEVPQGIIKVGILIDYSQEEAEEALAFLDLVQIYKADPFFPDKERIIFVVQGDSEIILQAKTDSLLQEYGYILLDAPRRLDGLLGGTGRLANWDLAKELAKRYNLILAGGLNPTNIQEAIEYVQPFAVDVASGVEIGPGQKDPILVEEFLKRCNDVK